MGEEKETHYAWISQGILKGQKGVWNPASAVWLHLLGKSSSDLPASLCFSSHPHGMHRNSPIIPLGSPLPALPPPSPLLPPVHHPMLRLYEWSRLKGDCCCWAALYMATSRLVLPVCFPAFSLIYTGGVHWLDSLFEKIDMSYLESKFWKR